MKQLALSYQVISGHTIVSLFRLFFKFSLKQTHRVDSVETLTLKK